MTRQRSKKWNVTRHGWKHASATDLEENARDVLAPRGKPLIRQAYFGLPSDEDLDLLGQRARKKDPKAVVRLWYVHRHREKLRRQLSEHSDIWLSDAAMKRLVEEIPDPVELGTEYIQAILAEPGKGSNHTRRLLRELTSQSSIFGTYSQRKLSPVPDDWADVTFIRAMAFSLVKQVRHANKFLQGAKVKPKRRIPEISSRCLSIAGNLANRLKHVGIKDRGSIPPDHQLANEITGDLLHLEPGHVKWILDQTTNRPKPVTNPKMI